MDTPKKLYRSRTDKVIAGVCGGLGDYFNMDSLIFRVLFLALLFAGGSGFWLYVILAIIIPKEPIFGVSEPGINPKAQFNDFVADVRSSAQHWAAEVKKDSRFEPLRNSRRMWFGVIIVAIGAIALINTLFPQRWIKWETLWPVMLIFFGLAIITKANNK